MATLEGRRKISWPDLADPGGVSLEAAVKGGVAAISDNLSVAWSGQLVATASQTLNFEHNFGIALSGLRVWVFDTDSGVVQLADDDADFTLANVDLNTISITNEDVVSRTFSLLVFAGRLNLRDEDFSALFSKLTFNANATTPSNPAADHFTIYPDANGDFFILDENGVSTPLGSGGSGGSAGINYVSKPDAEDQTLGAIGAEVGTVTGTGTAVVTDTPAEILVGTKSYKLAGGGLDDTTVDFDLETIDPFYLGKPLFVRCLSRALGSYASGGWAFGIYNSTDTSLITTTVREIPAGDFEFDSRVSFIPESGKSYVLRFFDQNANNQAIAVDQIFVGTQESVYASNLTDWVVTADNATNLTTNIQNQETRVRTSGDSVQVRQILEFSGVNVEGAVSPVVPAGITIDKAKLVTIDPDGATHDYLRVGTWSLVGNAESFAGPVMFRAISGNIELVLSEGTLAAFNTASNAPTTIANGHLLSIEWEVPSANTSSNVLTAKRSLEQYAFSSDTTDANALTSFAYGISGAAYPAAITATRTKRVEFQEPIQKSDKVQIFVFPNSTTKLDAARVHPAIVDGATSYGINAIPVAGSDTQIDITFGGGGASATVPWGDGSLAGYRWVVGVTKAGGLAELAAHGDGVPGYVTADAQTIYGPKTFDSLLTALAGLDVDGVSVFDFNNITSDFMPASAGQLKFGNISGTPGVITLTARAVAGQPTRFLGLVPSTDVAQTNPAINFIAGSTDGTLLDPITTERTRLFGFFNDTTALTYVNADGSWQFLNNVGIGTPSPEVSLHVEGEAYFSGDHATAAAGSVLGMGYLGGLYANRIMDLYTYGPTYVGGSLFSMGANSGLLRSLNNARLGILSAEELYFGTNGSANPSGEIGLNGGWVIGPASGNVLNTINGRYGFTRVNNAQTGTVNALTYTSTLTGITAALTILNGITATTEGTMIYLVNESLGSITINNNSGSASANNRIQTRGAGAKTLANNEVAHLVYSGSRWKLINL